MLQEVSCNKKKIKNKKPTVAHQRRRANDCFFPFSMLIEDPQYVPVLSQPGRQSAHISFLCELIPTYRCGRSFIFLFLALHLVFLYVYKRNVRTIITLKLLTVNNILAILCCVGRESNERLVICISSPVFRKRRALKSGRRKQF